ncbi:MAG: aminotransferase class V-fold PLP-dependent enzyme [Bacteroidia bacterium]|nr:MAG: aminotransferase class V-fold PLP-dependent enzyme [Bacteroidia bacterium]
MLVPDPYYFDHSASAPPYEEALEQFKWYSLNYPANPSSNHSSGKEASRKLLELKMRFCKLLDFHDGHLLLCSSATEANNTIIEGHRKRFPHGRILIAEDVHDSIWYATRKHKKHTDVFRIKDMEDLSHEVLARTVKNETTLICINQVCNETGRIHPLKAIAEFCSLRNIRLLVDGSQAIGHIPVSLNNISCDYFSFSAHKFGGTRSMGGLLFRDRQFEPLLSGGKHEWELRAGTENLPGLAAAVSALELDISKQSEHTSKYNNLKTSLLQDLKIGLKEVLINTPDDCRPGFLSLSFPGCQGNEIVAALSLAGFKIATGSACHADRPEPSRIILATGRKEKEAIGTIRISIGRGNTEESVKELGLALLDQIRC